MQSLPKQHGRPGVPKPWGWEMLWTRTPRYASKILFIRRGHQIGLQYHREKEESVFVRSGRLILILEDRRGGVPASWLRAGGARATPPPPRRRVCAPAQSRR